jgi:hypothetical protein
VIDSAWHIETAKKLLLGLTTEVDIRRSISTAYYALFHHICHHFSQIVIQPTTGSYERAWLQAYRYLDHGPARQRCQEVTAKDRKFPVGIVNFADAFVDLQQRRLEADYDPTESFTANDAHALIATAEDAIASFESEPKEAQRAFVLFLGLRPKNR